MVQNGSGAHKRLGMVVGYGIGVTWVVLAILTLVAAIRGSSYGRPDYALSWGLVGTFLLGAGLCSLIGTWWHTRHHEHRDLQEQA